MSISKGILFKSKGEKALEKALKNVIGFTPKYLPYYEIAITHRSKNDNLSQNNERLEFMGDAFIGAIVGEFLFKKYPSKDEGYLTEMRSKIVSRQSLNKIAMKMGLHKLVRYNSQDRSLRRSQIFGNALEALVGAIYLDTDFEKTRKFILKRMLSTFVDIDELEETEYNFKNKMYTWAQRNGKSLEFKTIQETLEAGRKVFTVGILLDGELLLQASGYNKKEASQRAAENALQVIVNEDEAHSHEE